MLTGTLTRNQEIPIDMKDSARRRVLCGLRWQPMADAGSGPASSRGPDKRGVRVNMHDLDLLCLSFDRSGRLMGGVTGEEGHRTGDLGNIYHTGDVVEGQDDQDDEQILLKLFNLSGKIHQVFFIAEVQSAHHFGDVPDAQIRLANAVDNTDYAITPIGTLEGGDKNAFVFGCLRRDGGSWVFRYIGDYLDGSQISDWPQALERYIERPAGAESGAGTGDGRAPQKGQTVPLAYSKTARQRVICGLSWDPEPVPAPGARKGGRTVPCDLDLACVIYDAKGEAVDGLSGKADETIDSSGKIYHTGDDTRGEGDRDDEAISVELRDLPGHIHHIVFLTEIQSGQTFSGVRNPAMRIADGKTEADQLAVGLGGGDGRDKTAFVFARISRKLDGWTLTYIGQYVDGRKVGDWIEHLKRYLG